MSCWSCRGCCKKSCCKSVFLQIKQIYSTTKSVVCEPPVLYGLLTETSSNQNCAVCDLFQLSRLMPVTAPSVMYLCVANSGRYSDGSISTRAFLKGVWGKGLGKNTWWRPHHHWNCSKESHVMVHWKGMWEVYDLWMEMLCRFHKYCRLPVPKWGSSSLSLWEEKNPFQGIYVKLHIGWVQEGWLGGPKCGKEWCQE